MRIYYSYWGTYAAYTMAALNTGLYRKDSLPPSDWIAAQYELCRRYGEQTGNLIYVGLDDQFREIYSLGCSQHAGMVVRALQHIRIIFAVKEPIEMISVEELEGPLPNLLHRLRFYDNAYSKNLFTIWFRRNYRKCQLKANKLGVMTIGG